MSYDTLTGGASFLAGNQLPALLTYLEGPIPRLYSDGANEGSSGNATIGVGINLKNNPAMMALVLNQMVYYGPNATINGLNVFQAASILYGESATAVVTSFENIVNNYTLVGPPDGLVPYPQSQNQSTINLQTALNNLLLSLFVPPAQPNNVTRPQLSNITNTFTLFSPLAQQTVLVQALNGVVAGVVPGYSAITGYSENTLTWLTGGNPWGIAVNPANLPPTNSGAWEALVSLDFNSPAGNKSLLGKGLLTALANDDLAQAWYQIRYATNSGWQNSQNGGVAKRRYLESQLFSLQQSTDGFGQAVQAYEMLTEHRSSVITPYESLYGTDPNSANPLSPRNQIELATKATSNTQTYAAPLSPVYTVAQAFMPYAETIAGALNTAFSQITGGIGVQGGSDTGDAFYVSPTNILVAPDTFDLSNGFATYDQDDVDPTDSPTTPHVILGPMSVDVVSEGAQATLKGALGSDILIAGAERVNGFETQGTKYLTDRA